MSYLHDRRNKKKKFGPWIFGALHVIGLLFFGSGILNSLSFGAQEIFRPILSLGNLAGEKFKNVGAYFISKNSLSKENSFLSDKLREADAKIANHDAILEENAILKEILGRTGENDILVLAAILSKPNRSAYDTMLVDAGSDEGIKIGDLALARGFIPLGRVADVTPNTAKVVMFSSSDEATPVRLSRSEAGNGEEKNILYDLIGRGGGNFELILPRDVKFEKGDTALLPGISARVLARAESVISDPRDPFKKVLLSSPVNFQHLNFVQIEIK